MKNIKDAVATLLDMRTTGVQKAYGADVLVTADALQDFGMSKELKEIAEHYGVASQTEQTRKELVELIEAIDKNDPENLIEEIADVTVMLNQIIYHYDAAEEVAKVREYKINRQLQRIAEEKKERA